MAKNIDDVQFLEGDAIAAASLNDRFDEIADGIDDLPVYAIHENTLKNVHLPSFVPSDVTPGALQTSLTASSFVKGISDYPTWSVLSDGGDDLAVEWPSAVTLGMGNATYRTAGVLVLANILVRNACNTLEGVPAGAVGLVVQITDDGVTWTNVDRTTRWLRPYDGKKWYSFLQTDPDFGTPDAVFSYPYFELPVAIRTYINIDDIASLKGVRIAYSSDNWIFAAVGGNLGNVVFRECNLTVIPFHASEDT